MNTRKNTAAFAGLILSVSLLTSALTALLLTNYYQQIHFQELSAVCRQITEQKQTDERTILSAIKEYTHRPAPSGADNLLSSYGYRPADFLHTDSRRIVCLVLVGFLSGTILLLAALIFFRRQEISRIDTLTDYLEKVNTQKSGVLFSVKEDAFFRLQDELYKTVTQLRQAKDAALTARSNFADNLSNIAHQIKTPITSISLSLQMLRRQPSLQYFTQIDQQLLRLTHLEESLLLLSRIDTGTLPLKRRQAGVYTILMLAADNLQELFTKAGVSIEIPYHTKNGPSPNDSCEIEIYADLDWTMEAILNLLKNCMEHTPCGGTVFCSYEQNSFYTQIRIWDTGNGFSKEDLPHLFERFYRGQNAKSGGIGIGLALARAIIESQDGTILAKNLKNAGACFEIRFYNLPCYSLT